MHGLSHDVVCVIIDIAVTCDGQIDEHDDSIYLASIASRGKNDFVVPTVTEKC